MLSASDIPLFKPPFEPQPPGARPENPLQFDAAYVFEPDGLAVREALRDGRLPVWSPELEAGWPLLATQQSAPLFPLTWIGVVFPYWESLAWIAVIKLTLAALGTFLFARALGLRRAPSVLAAVAFGFGTYLIVWLMHPHANAYVLLPWLLLIADRLCRTGAVRDAAALGGLLGVAYLSGQPESGMIVALATAAWVVHRLASARPDRRTAIRVGALAAAAALLGAAIGAVMILPLVEALRESFVTSRSGPPLPPKVGLSLAFPEYWGRPDGPALTPDEPSNFTERTLYVGALPALLALAGMFAARPRGPQLFFAGLTLASLAVALDTGPVSAIVGDLPILDQVALHRVLVLAGFGIAMLAAYGLQHLLDGTGHRRMLIAAALAAALPPLVILGAHPSWVGELPEAVGRLLGSHANLSPEVTAVASVVRWCVLAAATVGLAVALVRRPRRTGALAAVAVALAAFDLLALGWGYNPAIPKEQADPASPPAVEAMQRLTEGGGRVVSVDGLIPNTATRWGLHDARGHEQPVIERTTRLWLQLGTTGDGTVAVDPDSGDTKRLLDAFGVRAALLDPSRLTAAGDISARGFSGDRVAYAGPGGVVVQRRSPLPPAFMAYNWRTSGNLDESLLHMALSSARADERRTCDRNHGCRPRLTCSSHAGPGCEPQRHRGHRRGAGARPRAIGAAGQLLSRLACRGRRTRDADPACERGVQSGRGERRTARGALLLPARQRHRRRCDQRRRHRADGGCPAARTRAPRPPRRSAAQEVPPPGPSADRRMTRPSRGSSAPRRRARAARRRRPRPPHS